MAYGESNGHVTDDVTWPRKIKLVTPICLEPYISKTAGDRDSVSKDHNSKWPMGNRMVTWPMTSRESERSSRDSGMLRIQYRENSWRCYLATIANYQIVCCEAVRLAILAAAWLLVLPMHTYASTRPIPSLSQTVTLIRWADHSLKRDLIGPILGLLRKINGKWLPIL